MSNTALVLSTVSDNLAISSIDEDRAAYIGRLIAETLGESDGHDRSDSDIIDAEFVEIETREVRALLPSAPSGTYLRHRDAHALAALTKERYDAQQHPDTHRVGFLLNVVA